MFYITVDNHEHVRSCAWHLCEVACKYLKQISSSRADMFIKDPSEGSPMDTLLLPGYIVLTLTSNFQTLKGT